MWPFSSKKKPPIPAIRVGGISVRWNTQFKWWEFNGGEFYYSFCNPEFDVAVLNSLGVVKRWLVDLDHEINAEIKKHLGEAVKWSGEKQLVAIDVTKLISKHEIDVAYADGDEW